MISTKLFASMFALVAASFAGHQEIKGAVDYKHKQQAYGGGNKNAKSSFKQNKRRGL